MYKKVFLESKIELIRKRLAKMQQKKLRVRVTKRYIAVPAEIKRNMLYLLLAEANDKEFAEYVRQKQMLKIKQQWRKSIDNTIVIKHAQIVDRGEVDIRKLVNGEEIKKPPHQTQ